MVQMREQVTPERLRIFMREISRRNDLCMQALAKIERGFSQDLADARGLVEKKFISIENLRKRFAQIEDRFIRYPVINPDEFKAKLEAFISSLSEEPHDQ